MKLLRFTGRLVIILLACALLWGCAHTSVSSGTSESSGIGDPFGLRSNKGLIVGRGDSSSSLAEAEQLAKADVSAQIESSIRSQIDISQKTGIGPESDEHSVNNRIVVNSSFDHAELIRIERSSCQKDGRLCRALAVLDRNAADSFLETLWREESERLSTIYSQCVGAVDRKAFVACWNSVMEARQRLSRISCQRSAIAGYRPELFQLLSIPAGVIERRRQMVQDHPVFISIALSDHSPDLDTLASSALHRFGIVKASRCDPGGLRMAVEPSESCRLGATSYVCEIKLAIRVSPCTSPGSLISEYESEPGAFRASHGSSRERALQDAWKTLSIEKCSAVVVSAIRGSLPL